MGGAGGRKPSPPGVPGSRLTCRNPAGSFSLITSRQYSISPVDWRSFNVQWLIWSQTICSERIPVTVPSEEEQPGCSVSHRSRSEKVLEEVALVCATLSSHCSAPELPVASLLGDKWTHFSTRGATAPNRANFLKSGWMSRGSAQSEPLRRPSPFSLGLG